MSTEIDNTDLEIIDLLRKNARRTLGDIGKTVSLSPAAVKRRLDRLEAQGYVLGYTVVTDETKLGRTVEAYTELRIYGRAVVEDLIKLATTIPEVDAIYVTAGDPDFIVRLRAENNERLLAIVNQFRRSQGVGSTKTHIVLGFWDRMREA
jgi:Lrp/AsnC family transcriptional regulator, leucine-responsive regulatory protein